MKAKEKAKILTKIIEDSFHWLWKKEESIKSCWIYRLFQQVSAPVKVMACAGALYAITYYIIQENIIQYTRLPETRVVWFKDGKAKKTENTTIKVINHQPLKEVVPALDKTTPLPGTARVGPSTKQEDGKTIEIIDDVLIHQNPSFLVWTMLVVIMMSTAGGSLPIFINYQHRLRNQYNLNWKTIWLARGFALVVLGFMLFASFSLKGFYGPDKILRDFSILLKLPEILPSIVIATAILVAPSFVVIHLIGIVSKQLLPSGDTPDIANDKVKIEQTVTKFEQLNQMLKNVLQLHAIIVVFTALTSYALGESIRAVVTLEHFDIYPKEIPLVYGLFFSVYLFGLYVPTHMYLRSCYNDYIGNIPQLNIEHSKEWIKSVTENVQIDGNLVENIKLALTMLSPLLTLLLPDGFNLFEK